ncbi:MAG TPA: hypothetical protein VNZ22_13920, partial [Bacillota bacterium]|nr:hypothetical protein [Bacillota bacterium]
MMKRLSWVFMAVGLAMAATAPAQQVVQDSFESGTFASGWGLTSGVTLPATGGANGTSRFAHLAAYSATSGRELGARFDAVAPDGARDFALNFAFRVPETTQRQFNLHVSTSTGGVGSGSPAISLRYQAGWAAYDGSAWQPISGLGSVTAGQWYRLRVTGQNWGQSGARYAVALSDAGSTNLTSSATNLTWYQGGTPTANAARYFAFTTVYGNNPGFDVDEVAAEVTGTAPAETNAILNISGTYPHLTVFNGDGEIGIGAVVPW